MTSLIHRRGLLAGAACLLAPSLAPSSARAAWRPSHPVTIVVPYPAGGGTDVLARLLARELATMLEGSVVVENAPGASGAVGSRRVARAEPDGHTLLVTTNQTHATNLSLLKGGGGYDPVKDFTVLGGLADLQHLLVVRKGLEAGSVKDLIARAGKEPKLTCASTGIGSASHLTMELFQVKTGVDFVHVPYRGAAPLLQDMVGGRIDLAFATVPTVLGQVQAGELRALAVASPSPSPQVPGVPTLAQEGVAGVEADAWIAAFAPAGLPADIRARYVEAIGAILARPETKAAIDTQGMLPNWREPEAFAAFQKEDIRRWAEIIKAARVSIE
ncbi:tripartite tricarboxylate transporter substrate binding protein [Enterovirga sp.]|uniref:Bug family tripartite tricarboxylate transporter substrate binding protein n=1 Tax=Enterovirga sp. TaxID=2026350 RepID=UPI002B83AB73|nr:tripartite tricarboxylate transporter substrate binding protein [Enterovirga sp.]HMO29305.1 tripartite tricarboxylate transporter substrate binding protein [Enterovirga sp.]